MVSKSDGTRTIVVVVVGGCVVEIDPKSTCVSAVVPVATGMRHKHFRNQPLALIVASRRAACQLRPAFSHAILWRLGSINLASTARFSSCLQELMLHIEAGEVCFFVLLSC
jgi:hypothetical protein